MRFAMLITPRDIETFTALNRHRYLRANFIHRLVGGSKQNVCRRLGILFKAGYLSRPPQQLQSFNARYAPRVYELTPKSRAVLQQHGVAVREWHGEIQFWHRLMIADIVSSFEVLAKINGLPFKDQWDILANKPMTLTASIEWGKLKSDKPIEPDALFAVGNTYLLLEADRGTESVERSNLHQASYLRKLLCYRDVLTKHTAQHEWEIPDPIVLTVTTKATALANILKLFIRFASHYSKRIQNHMLLPTSPFPFLAHSRTPRTAGIPFG